MYLYFLKTIVPKEINFRKYIKFINELGYLINEAWLSFLGKSVIFVKNLSMKQRILFVCLGNICRSPAAEAVLQMLVERGGLSDRVVIDSPGNTNPPL